MKYVLAIIFLVMFQFGLVILISTIIEDDFVAGNITGLIMMVIISRTFEYLD